MLETLIERIIDYFTRRPLRSIPFDFRIFPAGDNYGGNDSIVHSYDLHPVWSDEVRPDYPQVPLKCPHCEQQTQWGMRLAVIE